MLRKTLKLRPQLKNRRPLPQQRPGQSRGRLLERLWRVLRNPRLRRQLSLRQPSLRRRWECLHRNRHSALRLRHQQVLFVQLHPRRVLLLPHRGQSSRQEFHLRHRGRRRQHSSGRARFRHKKRRW